MISLTVRLTLDGETEKRVCTEDEAKQLVTDLECGGMHPDTELRFFHDSTGMELIPYVECEFPDPEEVEFLPEGDNLLEQLSKREEIYASAREAVDVSDIAEAMGQHIGSFAL